MTTERPGGALPIEPGGRQINPNTKAEREAKQRVEQVREIDPDEKARQQRRDKFQSYLNDADAEEAATARKPSPFEADFYNAPPTNKDSVKEMKSDEIPNPSNTPPPDLAHPAPTQTTEETEEGLPQSKQFWVDTDLPPDQPLPNLKYKEQVHKTTQPGLVVEAKKTSEVPTAHKTKQPREKEPVVVPIEMKKEPGVQLTDKKTKTDKKAPTTKKTEAESFWVTVSPKGQRGDQQPGKKPPKEFQLDPSLFSHMSPAVHTTAQTATQRAAPLLTPESVALFYQMVGTIYMSLPPGSGISQTVIVLNQAAFANSKFFGATITIEKYATAPDALNIRLTGSNSAVVAFRDNIPELMNAFQNSKLPFKINRIDAEFAAERPVFRRKDAKRGTDLGGELGEGRRH